MRPLSADHGPGSGPIMSKSSAKQLRAQLVFSALVGAYACLAPIHRAQAQDLSLGLALSKARRQNLEVQASREAVTVEEHDFSAAMSRFYPKIDVEARYSHLNAPIELDLDAIRRAIIGGSQTAATVAAGPAAGTTTAAQLGQGLPPFTIQLQEQDVFNSALTLSQPIYSGGRLTANKDARSQELKVAKLESSDAIERILVSTAQSYFNVKLAELNLNVRLEVLEGLKTHRKISEQLLSEGQITRINLMNADLRVKEAEAAHIKASYDLDLSRKSLSMLLNEDVTKSRLSTELALNGSIEAIDAMRGRAAKSNKRLLISAAKADMLEQKKDSIEADYLPTVFAFGRYELYKKYLTATEPEWVVGVGMKMNLYSGGETRESLASVVAEKAAVRNQIEAVTQAIELGVDKAYSDLASAKQQFEFLDAAVKVAEESIVLINAAFKGGTARSIDVTDAYNSLAQTKLARLKCLSDYNFAYFQLKRLTGEAEDIKGDRP